VYSNGIPPPRYHLLESEMTTGRSLHAFLSDMPAAAFEKISMSVDGPIAATSWLGLAAALGLQLFICDAVAKQPCLLKDSEEKLLECALRGKNKAKYETAVLLLEKGYTPRERISDLWPALWQDSNTWPQRALHSDSNYGIFERDIALLLMEQGWDIQQNIVSRYGPQYLPRTQNHGIRDSSSHSILHNALPELTSFLLNRNFDPNVVDNHGATPLDWILDLRDIQHYPSLTEKARLLAEAGGYPKRSRVPVKWDVAMVFLSPMQLNIWIKNGWTAPPRRKIGLLQKVKDKLGQT
jgi:hypothetical protein